MPRREGTELGRRLRALREAAGLSQDRLAKTADLATSVVVRAEHHGGEELRLGTLRALVRALGCTWEELVGPDPAEPSAEPVSSKASKGRRPRAPPAG